jgi:hypothetical protein
MRHEYERRNVCMQDGRKISTLDHPSFLWTHGGGEPLMAVPEIDHRRAGRGGRAAWDAPRHALVWAGLLWTLGSVHRGRHRVPPAAGASEALGCAGEPPGYAVVVLAAATVVGNGGVVQRWRLGRPC